MDTEDMNAAQHLFLRAVVARLYQHLAERQASPAQFIEAEHAEIRRLIDEANIRTDGNEASIRSRASEFADQLFSGITFPHVEDDV